MHTDAPVKSATLHFLLFLFVFMFVVWRVKGSKAATTEDKPTRLPAASLQFQPIDSCAKKSFGLGLEPAHQTLCYYNHLAVNDL